MAYGRYPVTVNKETNKAERDKYTVKEKTSAQRAKRLNELSWSSHCNLNVNVLIDFYCLWCIGKSPEEKKYPTVMINWYLQLCFLNEQIKEMRRQKAKRHGCPFRIPSRIQTTMKLFFIKQGNIQGEKVDEKE